MGTFEIVFVLIFVAWCVAVFFFLRVLSARAERSAAKGEPGRKEIDEVIAKVRKATEERESES